MGRPWWYDKYPGREYKPKPRFRVPRKLWVWGLLLLASVLLALNRTDFRPLWLFGFVSFVSYLCQILAFAILIRILLSWFSVSRYNGFFVVLTTLPNPSCHGCGESFPR